MALATNLISYWKMDEASGNAADSVGSYTGTSSGSGVTYTTGKISNAVNTAGNSYLGLTSSALFSTGSGQAFTVAGWFKGNSSSSTAQYRQAFGFKGGIGFRWSWGDGGVPYGSFFYSTTTNDYVTPNLSLSSGTWYHIACVYDGSVMKLYVNGTQSGSDISVTAGTRKDSGSNNIGAGSGNNDFFDGLIDELGLWTRALSGAEIAELYNSGNGMTYPFATAYTKSLTETVSLVQTMANKPGKNFVEVINVVEVVTKRASRTLTDVITLVSASTAGKISTKAITEAVSLVDTISEKITAKTLVEAISLVDTAASRFSVKYLIEAITLADSNNATRLYTRAFVDTITLNATLSSVIALGRILTETISLTVRWQGLKNGLNIKNVQRYLDRAGTYIRRYLDLP